MSRQHHPAVQHPVALRIRRHKGRMGPVGRANDYLLTHLAVVFGLAWTVWIFMTVTVAAYWMPAALQARIFFFSSGCIQLFALPLMVYVGNKLQRSSDAQSEVMHEALTHVAAVSDQNADRLDAATPGGLADVLAAVRKLEQDLLDRLDVQHEAVKAHVTGAVSHVATASVAVPQKLLEDIAKRAPRKDPGATGKGGS